MTESMLLPAQFFARVEFFPLPAAHKFNLPMSVHKSMQQNGNNSIQTHTHTGILGVSVAAGLSIAGGVRATCV